MSDTRLMFFRHGRILVPLLFAYIITAVIAVFLKDNIQIMMIFSIVSMLLSVGATVYSLDYLVRFFALGEDLIFHLSSSSRAATCLRASMVLIIYVMGFFLVGQITMSILIDSSSWHSALLFGVINKLASLICAFSLMLLISAAVKVLRNRLLMRIVSWTAFVLISGVCAASLISWLIDPIRAIDWAIGSVDYQTVSVYAGAIPVMIPADSSIASITWTWSMIDTVISVFSIASFIAIFKLLNLNYLSE